MRGVMRLLEMKLTVIILCLILCACSSTLAQEHYSLPACTSASRSGRVVGGRIKLRLPKGAILKQGRDIDYADYAVGFGPKKSRAWLQGIYGPVATSGIVPEEWLSASVEVTNRAWTFADLEGVDAKGKLANGHYWRYLGQYGESIRYYDVPAEAATYFDDLINKVCFLDWR